jgi:hypothetical protein
MEQGSEDLPYQYTFVADEGTASAMTNAAINRNADPRRLWSLLVVLLIAGAGLLLIVTGDGPWTTTDWIGAFVFGAAILLVVLIGCLWYLAHMLTLRNLRESAFSGARYQSRFEPDSFVIAGPNMVTRYQYDSVHGVVTHDGFVVFLVRGSRAPRVLPEELFPESALRRLDAKPSRGSGRVH